MGLPAAGFGRAGTGLAQNDKFLGHLGEKRISDRFDSAAHGA